MFHDQSSKSATVAGRPRAIDPGRVAFDIDGVIADTMGLFLEIARDEFGIRHLRYDAITSYALEDCLDLGADEIASIVDRLLGREATARLKPIDGAPEVVRRIADAAGSVLFVTARPTADAIEAWLQDLLRLPASALSVVATGSFDGKADVLREHGIDFFVEDRLETCFEVETQGISPILYRQPWNRRPHPFPEVRNWRELAALIAL